MIKTRLNGVTFQPAKANMQKLAIGQVLGLVSYRFEKGTFVDEFAVKVMNGEDMCGHIPAKGGINQLFSGNSCKVCTVTNLIRKGPNGFSDDPNDEVVSVEVEADIALAIVDTPAALSLEKPKEEPTHLKCEKVKSFNEDGVTVNFYPRPYYGFWYNGKRLYGVTRKIDTMYKPFDSDRVAGLCSRNWEMTTDDIKDMWSRNGDITNQFGKIIHSGLENYETDNDHRINMDNKDVVEKINNVIALMKTNYDSYGTRGLAKMSVLKEIALDNTPIPEITELCGDIVTTCPLSKADEVLTEVLVTDVENGVCGFIDRLARVGDVYQVQDYKINVESEKSSKQQHENLLFPSLPYTKVSHYVCQESYYTELIGRTRKVSDTVVSYIWDGEWHLKELGRIHGIVAVIDKAKAGAKEDARQAELSKGDGDKIVDLIAAFDSIKESVMFDSAKNKKLFVNVQALCDKVIKYIKEQTES